MNATDQGKDEKLFSLLVSGKSYFIIFSFSMTEIPPNYGYKENHLYLNLMTAFHLSDLNVETNFIPLKKITSTVT
jgi:hypothetical protein